MNERQLRYACGVWRERSFSRAADRLRVSQPSLSDQVRLLEEEVGFPIFYRGARGIEPSVNGLAFLERSSELLGSLTKLEKLAERLRGREQEVFRIGLNTGIADRFLSEISAINKAHAGLRLEIATSTNRRIQRLVQQGKLDAGLLLNADLSSWADKLKVVFALESEIVLVMLPDHELAGREVAPDLAALADYPLIVSETELGLGRAVLAAFRQSNTEPNIVADCDNVSSVKTMVMSGVGIALLPMVCVSDEIAKGRLCARPLAHRLPVPVQLVQGLRNTAPSAEIVIAGLANHIGDSVSQP